MANADPVVGNVVFVLPTAALLRDLVEYSADLSSTCKEAIGATPQEAGEGRNSNLFEYEVHLIHSLKMYQGRSQVKISNLDRYIHMYICNTYSYI